MFAAAVRKQKAFDLRIEGCSYQDIATQLGYSACSAHRDVMEVLAKVNERTQESAIQLREIETARLDKLYKACQAGIKCGDPKSIDVALKIQNRRAKLWNLDSAPKESNLELALAQLLTGVTAVEGGGDDTTDA